MPTTLKYALIRWYNIGRRHSIRGEQMGWVTAGNRKARQNQKRFQTLHEHIPQPLADAPYYAMKKVVVNNSSTTSPTQSKVKVLVRIRPFLNGEDPKTRCIFLEKNQITLNDPRKQESLQYQCVTCIKMF